MLTCECLARQEDLLTNQQRKCVCVGVCGFHRASRLPSHPPHPPRSLSLACAPFLRYNGHITTLSYMVEQGADVNAVTEDGVSSLHFAALHKQGATVDWLLAHGAKPDVVTKGGVTPAHYALYAGDAVLAAKVHALAKSST